jgi:hypothetical protein
MASVLLWLPQTVYAAAPCLAMNSAHVLRTQLERTMLLNELSMQRRESAQAQLVLKGLLNRAPESHCGATNRQDLLAQMVGRSS